MNSNDFDNIQKSKLKEYSEFKYTEYTTKNTYFYIMKNSSTLKA